ncbi:hypothetical protein MJ257_16690, partial [Paenibacillus timonensis]|uniref:hypothetical protein n=1 Tax=Paenibacillus timonensis TaxID=225915 RepID=UPI001F0683DE
VRRYVASIIFICDSELKFTMPTNNDRIYNISSFQPGRNPHAGFLTIQIHPLENEPLISIIYKESPAISRAR